MNKKLLALGLGAGLLAEVAVHGYFDVMARPYKYNSLIGLVANKLNDDNMSEITEFNRNKQEWISKQNNERITMKSARNQELVAYLTYPEKESDVFVLFAHGYHADHTGDSANFLRYYVEKGYNFLAVDHVASGESEGLFVGFDYFESTDCLKWIDYLIERFGKDIKIIIHGVSMGGATVCKMVENVPSQVKLAISDCPYTSAIDQFDATARGVGVPRTKELLVIFNAMNKVLAKYDLYDTDVRNSVINARIPMLFVHGEADDFVPTRMGKELYELCGSEKELFLVPNAKHAESIRVDEAGYHAKLDEFISKHMEG